MDKKDNLKYKHYNLQQLKKTKKQIQVPDKPITKWLCDYTDIYGRKGNPATEGFMERLAEAYVQWAENDEEAIRADAFAIKNKIPPQTFDEWCVRFDNMKMANAIVFDIISHRRERIATKFNPNNSLRMMPYYDKKWKGIEEWRARIKSESTESKAPQIVILSELEAKEKIREHEATKDTNEN